MNNIPTITEADLHAYIDGQLSAERTREIESYLASRPDEMQRLEAYREQKHALRSLFDPVLDEPLPNRLMQSARPRMHWSMGQIAASVAIAVASGTLGWGLRGGVAPSAERAQVVAKSSPDNITLASASDFAQRAVVAHAVFSPDQRRPVEVDAAHEDQLVAWLSKRMRMPMKPPHLQSVGYALEGGRLLPGGQGPVAQFMYRDESGRKLTVYVSREAAHAAESKPNHAGTTAFRFAEQGDTKVFYWVDGGLGYAITAQADKPVLTRVSDEVYRQLNAVR